MPELLYRESPPDAPPVSARSDREPVDADREALRERFDRVRDFTRKLCEPLDPEDMLLQSMPDVSPTKWHLAHTTWFFERFVLAEHAPSYESVDPHYDFLFNSYYQAVGPMHARPRRGLLSRPTLSEVRDYRATVEARLRAFANDCDAETWLRVAPLIVLGCHHEQQHQELILTDIKYNLFQNPIRPAYHAPPPSAPSPSIAAPGWIAFAGGVHPIGGSAGEFGFDNEYPRHEVLLRDFALAARPVTNGEYRRFIEDDGYRRPELWLDLGFATVAERGWERPLYWEERDGRDAQFTLGGPLPWVADEPVCHLSFFEADAYARWAGARLPTEAEWEVAAAHVPVDGHFADAGAFHPRPAPAAVALRQLFGDVWEWTASPYVGHPGYRPQAGAIGEYNGKFMGNQYVLRGGSCATSRDHVRRSYRNFFPPDARWQFSGLRLAQDA